MLWPGGHHKGGYALCEYLHYFSFLFFYTVFESHPFGYKCMFINNLLKCANTAQRRDTGVTLWPACMLPAISVAVLTGINLGICLCRGVRVIICLPPPIQCLNIDSASHKMAPGRSDEVFSCPVIAEIMRYADSRGDALALSSINREAFHARFFNPHLQSLHFKTVAQVNRFLIYCTEIVRAGQTAGNGVLLRHLSHLASIRTVSLALSDTLSVSQSLPLFECLPGISCLKISINKGAEPGSINALDSLFRTLQPLALQHLKIVCRWNWSGSGETENLPVSLWNLTSLESLKLQNLINMNTISDQIGQLENLRILAMENMALEALPNTIEKLTRLEMLELIYLDRLTVLPDGIGRLSALTSLKLANLLRLVSLPDSLVELKGLVYLDLIDLPCLDALPARMGQLKALRDLCLWYLPCLGALPEEIWQLGSLQKLVLDNIPNLTTISGNIGGLTALTSLSIGKMEICDLPESLWQLPRLEELYLYSMRELSDIRAVETLTSLRLLNLPSVRALPREMYSLPKLEALVLSEMKQFQLPAEISHLTALGSLILRKLPRVRELPADLWQLNNLQKLVLDSLPLIHIPAQISQLPALTSLILRKLPTAQLLADILERLGHPAQIKLVGKHDDPYSPQALRE